jgi:hypothetical protein
LKSLVLEIGTLGSVGVEATKGSFLYPSLTGISHPIKNGFDPSGYGRVRAREMNLNG